MHGGRHAEEQSGRERDRQSEQQHRAVNLDCRQAWHVCGLECLNPPDAGQCEQDAAGAARGREQQALGQELPHDVSATGAQGHAQRDFLAAIEGARQQQVRHVGACDQQHTRDCREQGPENRPHIPNDLLQQRHHAERQAAVRGIQVRVFLPKAGRERIHFHLGGLGRDPGLEHAHEVVVLAGADGCGVGGQRQGKEQVAVGDDPQRWQHLAGEAEGLWEDADHGVWLAVDRQDLGHDVGILAKPPRPKAVAQNRGWCGPRGVLEGLEQTAHHRFGAQHRQQVRADPDGADPFRSSFAGQIGVGAQGNRQLFESGMPGLDVEVLRCGKPVFGNIQPRRAVPENGQPVRVGVGQRLEEQGARHAENGGIGADPQRQRDNGGQSQAGRPAQRAEGMANGNHGDVRPHRNPARHFPSPK